MYYINILSTKFTKFQIMCVCIPNIYWANLRLKFFKTNIKPSKILVLSKNKNNKKILYIVNYQIIWKQNQWNALKKHNCTYISTVYVIFIKHVLNIVFLHFLSKFLTISVQLFWQIVFLLCLSTHNSFSHNCTYNEL